MIFQRSCCDIIISRFDAWLSLFSCGICTPDVLNWSVFLLCQIWKVKAKSKLIKFWWFEIKLASQKIVVMEEGKIDELVYNDVVDILNLRFCTWQEREACCDSKEICPVLREACPYQNGWIFGKVPKGGGVISNPKIFIANFGLLNRVFLA